jgi:hypothetical protein
MMKQIVAALLAIAITGCASVGRPIAKDKISLIRLGVTTEVDLIRMFGGPSSKAVDSNGKILMTWVYSEASTKPETFIPLAGPFVGGMNTRVQQLSVVIGRNHTVEHFTMNDSPGEVKYGRRGSD